MPKVVVKAGDTRDNLACLLALTAWREARSDGIEGMRSVMHVVMNRVNAGWGDMFTCITKKNQFTSISVPGDPQLTLWPSPTDTRFISALEEAYLLTFGATREDPTNGALFYENPAYATSKWFVDNVRNKRKIVAKIGEHVFYA